MKVSMWYSNSDIRLEEVETPSPGPGQMLVEVVSCGICGSDVVEWYRKPRAPLVQGHEVGVKVVETGEGVTRFAPGDRLFIAPKVACGQCRYCRAGHHPQCTGVKDRLPGGFAEYISVPKTLVDKGAYHLPDGMSYDQATFVEPLACAVRAQRLAGVETGQTVLVLGSGMSGLMHVKLLKDKGCRIVATDLNPGRLELARGFGAEHVMDAATDVGVELSRLCGQKADVVIVTTSALPALEQAWQCVDKGGAVVLFAVPGPGKDVVVPVNDFWTQEIRILTSYYCGPPDIEASMDLIASGRVAVDDLITHRLPLSDTARGFELVLAGTESLKVIIKPNQG